MILIKNLQKQYSVADPFKLYIHNLHLKIGINYLLLGPNGAGKSTLIKLLLDLIHPDTGEILIDNIDSSNKNSRNGIGYLPEEFSFPENYTFYECLYYFGIMKIPNKKELKQNIDEICEALNLKKYYKKKVKNLSKGMMQSLALAHALLGENKMLILDEPFNGLDPLQKEITIKYLKRKCDDEDICLLITTHILSDTEKIGDEIILINNGSIIDHIDPNTLDDGYKGLEKYFIQAVTEKEK